MDNELINRNDALTVAMYNKDPVEGIRNLPTVGVADVVLCQECKWQKNCKLAQRLGTDGFCSEGERKE